MKDALGLARTPAFDLWYEMNRESMKYMLVVTIKGILYLMSVHESSNPVPATRSVLFLGHFGKIRS